MPVGASCTADDFVFIVTHEWAGINQSLAKIPHRCFIEGKVKVTFQSGKGCVFLFSWAQAFIGSIYKPAPHLNSEINTGTCLYIELVLKGCTWAAVCWHEASHNRSIGSPTDKAFRALRKLLFARSKHGSITWVKNESNLREQCKIGLNCKKPSKNII